MIRPYWLSCLNPVKSWSVDLFIRFIFFLIQHKPIDACFWFSVYKGFWGVHRGLRVRLWIKINFWDHTYEKNFQFLELFEIFLFFYKIKNLKITRHEHPSKTRTIKLPFILFLLTFIDCTKYDKQMFHYNIQIQATYLCHLALKPT